MFKKRIEKIQVLNLDKVSNLKKGVIKGVSEAKWRALTWYQLDKDLFSRNKVSNEGLWIKGALSFCVQTGTFCNFLCPFCLSNSGPNGTTKNDWIEMALINLNNIVGPSRIIWAGGEPTLMPELDRFLGMSKSLGNINIVTTNGSVYFSSPYIDWIDFSIYGVDDQSYKVMTGRSACDKVWQNLKKVTKTQSRVSVNAILNLNSTTTIIKIIERCFDLGILRVKLHRPLPIGCLNNQISEIDTLRAIKEIRNSVPKEMIVSYPLTNSANEMISAYWVVMSPGVISNNLIELPLSDQTRVLHEIENNINEHYKIFVKF